MRFRGLPFARWQVGRIYLGLDARWEELRGGNQDKRKQLVLRLQSTSPLVYLLAPWRRFRPSTDALLRYLSPEIEVIRVGLAESWRSGLRVVLRQ